jgi:hypothetical protein
MPAGFEDPGDRPDDALPKILNKLRLTLKDPYSVRDVRVCEPEMIRAYYGLTWVRAHWVVKLALNAKNGFGAYTGLTAFTARFENGEVSDVSQFRGLDLVGPAVNAKLLSTVQSCPRVSDTEVQRLLAS